MKILVFGGTRFIGKYLVEELLKQGHEVSVATRGNLPIIWKNVNSYIVERLDVTSIKKIPKIHWDVVYDDLVLSSEGIRDVLDNVECKRYIMISTDGVYKKRHIDIVESEFDATTESFEYVPYSKEIPYDTRKRFAESALFQDYKHIPAVSVRFPVVLGKEDYTGRLKFYVDCILNSVAIYCDNRYSFRPFISAEEAGRFLAFLSNNPFVGVINAASNAIKLDDIFDYLKNKYGHYVSIRNDGAIAPFNGVSDYSLNTELADSISFKFSNINDWIFELIDYYVNSRDKNWNGGFGV